MRLGLVVAALTITTPALAHDQWLEPTTAIVPAGTKAEVRLFVGEDLKSDEEKAFERAKFTRLSIASRNGPIDLLGALTEGAKPVVVVDRLGDGEFLVAADRAPVHIELTPEKFEAYLKEESLEPIIKERAKRGESKNPGRERYMRFLKSLVHVGHDAPHGLATNVLGQKLEIVLDRAPTATAKIAGRVLFDGRPLADVAVDLHVRSKDGKVSSHRANTTPDGKVTFPILGAGFAEARLVHMRRCVSDCKDTEWESFWTSFTFTLSEPRDGSGKH